MGYVGVPPQSGFITTAKQRVTSSTNNYVDLDHSISSLADVIVWVNFVKQDSTNLTLTTSSRITLGGTLVSSDIVEIAYLGKAVATQTPSSGTVTNDMLAGSIANSKLANSSITLNGSAVSLGGSATIGGGKINQLLNTTAIVNTTITSDAELMSLAITPSATSSKIYMLFTGSCQMGADEYASWDFYRGSLSSGTKILDGGETVFNGYNNIRLGFSMSFLDSPNTTSATTYTVVGSPVIGSIQYGATGRNTLTLMEVLA